MCKIQRLLIPCFFVVTTLFAATPMRKQPYSGNVAADGSIVIFDDFDNSLSITKTTEPYESQHVAVVADANIVRKHAHSGDLSETSVSMESPRRANVTMMPEMTSAQPPLETDLMMPSRNSRKLHKEVHAIILFCSIVLVGTITSAIGIKTVAGPDALAWAVTCLGIALQTVLLSMVWGLWAYQDFPAGHDYSCPAAWLAVTVASILFGFTEVPLKISGAQDLGPSLFNAVGWVGNGSLHCTISALLFLHGGSFHFQWQAVLAALGVMMVQTLARAAIWRMGIAIAPPLWCAVGMITAFSLGTLAFGDKPENLRLCLGGLSLLICSSFLIRRSRIVDELSDVSRQNVVQSVKSQDTALSESKTGWDSRAQMETTLPVRSAHAIGTAYALCTGLLDGSLGSCFQLGLRDSLIMRSSSLSSHLCSYFGTFGLALVGVGLLSTMGLYLTSSSSLGLPRQPILASLCSGCLWAGGHTCSALSSQYLGMSLSFPLTQTGCIWGALIAVGIFREIQSTYAKSMLCSGLLLCTLGAAILSIFSKPEPGNM